MRRARAKLEGSGYTLVVRGVAPRKDTADLEVIEVLREKGVITSYSRRGDKLTLHLMHHHGPSNTLHLFAGILADLTDWVALTDPWEQPDGKPVNWELALDVIASAVQQLMQSKKAA